MAGSLLEQCAINDEAVEVVKKKKYFEEYFDYAFTDPFCTVFVCSRWKLTKLQSSYP